MNIYDFCGSSFKHFEETLVHFGNYNKGNETRRELWEYFYVNSFQHGIFPTKNEHFKVPGSKIPGFLGLIDKVEVPSIIKPYKLI